jgi:hypothetical protein
MYGPTQCCRRNFAPARRRSRSNPHKSRSGIVAFFRSWRACARIWADADLECLGSLIREFRRKLGPVLREQAVRNMIVAQAFDRYRPSVPRPPPNGAPHPGPLPAAGRGSRSGCHTEAARPSPRPSPRGGEREEERVSCGSCAPPHPGPLPAAGRGRKSGCHAEVARPSPRPSPRSGEREEERLTR